MGRDEASLLRLWHEKRGTAPPEDLSANLLVQLGTATEDLNRRWYQAQTGDTLSDIQRHLHHPTLPWMAATLDGLAQNKHALFEAKFMLPFAFSEPSALDKHRAQLQHNMLVTGTRKALLSVITGAGRWVLLEMEADPLYQTVLLHVERSFWRCVQTGQPPRLFEASLPGVRPTPTRIMDMSLSNAWAEFAACFLRTRHAHAEHEAARCELKRLMPQEAREAAGHGVRAHRSKAGAISFEVLAAEPSHAPVQ